MSKFNDFYAKAIADEATKKELGSILGDKPINDATDEQLKKIGELAKKIGFDITLDEAKKFLSPDAELDDEDLDAVAGGAKGGVTTYTPSCPASGLTICGSTGIDGTGYENPLTVKPETTVRVDTSGN